MNDTRNSFNAITIGSTTTKREAPFSLRLTFEGRAALHKLVGEMPLGAYIKAVLFDGAPHEVQKRQSNRSRMPTPKEVLWTYPSSHSQAVGIYTKWLSCSGANPAPTGDFGAA